MIKKYILNIGLNDKATLKQEIPTTDAIDIIKNAVAGAGFGGFTIYGGIGFYTMDNGPEVVEKSLKVEILDFNNGNINQVIQAIGTALNQESIALQVEESVDSDLIYII